MQNEKLFPISTGEPTYWPSDKNKTPDLIDLVIVKRINHEYFTATSCLDLSSDHSPIIILLNQELKMVQKATYLSNKKTDWIKFKEYINYNLTCNQSLKTAEEIDKAVEDFNMLLHSAAKEATPQFRPSNQTKTIPKYILEKIQELRRLKRSWQIIRSKPIKTTLNKITKDLKNMLIEENNTALQKYLENLTPTEATDYSMWKAAKKLNRPQLHIPPIRTNSGDWARNDLDKANTFAEYLSSVFEPSTAESQNKIYRKFL